MCSSALKKRQVFIISILIVFFQTGYYELFEWILTAVNTSPHIIRYWQTTQIKFNDGMQISVVLDAPTLQRLQEGDAALMDKIRKNAQESALTIPTAGTSSDCPVSHSSTSTDATSGESSSSQPKFGTKNDTMLLITTRMSMEDDFNSMKTHKSLWQKIAEEISAKGEVCTAKQCENKFKSLKRDYKATVDHNNTSGNTPKTCPFYEEFNSMYGMKASSRPECTLSSIAGVENPQQPKMKKRKRHNQTDDPSPDWLKQYEERQVAFNESRLQQIRDMHSETMTLMERLLSVLEKKTHSD